MPQLVDPKSGDIFDVPDDDAERSRGEYGLVSPDEYRAQQESPLLAAARVGSAAVGAPLEMADKALRKVGLGSYDASQDPNASPGALDWQKQNEASLGEFFNKAALAKEAHPTAALAGELLPMGITGALAGGIGAGLAGGGALGTAAGLGVESAATGMSQEAVDAITQKRDFSAKAALMNGGVNLALGGLFIGAGHALSGAAGRAGKVLGEEAGAASGVRPTEGVPGARNWLGEIDPGEVPDAVQGGRNRAPRTAESAGAAAKNFDDLDAAKAISEIKQGKVAPGPIADAAPTIREQLSVEAARDADLINEVLYDDAGLAAKHEDFAKGAAEWTPEMVEKQRAWLGDMTEKSAQAIEAIRAIPDAKGLGVAAEEAIQKGLRRINLTEGAGLNVGLDAFKRSGDSLIARIGSAANSAVDQETRQAVMNQVRSVTDSLREGMLDEGLFGANARIQAAHNEPLHEMIGALGRVQKKLYEVTGRTWGETGVGSIERRADPDAFRRLFEDPHLGGKLFQQDLAHVLDQAETLGRNRLEHGMSRLERLPEFIEKLQNLRDDLNSAQVLHAAEEAAGGGHGGTGGASTGAALASNVLLHAAEYGGRKAGFAFGNVARQLGWMGKGAHALDRLATTLGLEGEMAKTGTATRSLLDRYAGRVKGSDLLADPLHQARMPASLQRFLEQAHAPPVRTGVPPMPPGAGTGTPGTPQAPPGSPANDVRGQVAGVAALAGGGALLASGQASAAMLPEDQQARDQLTQQLSALTPEQQQARIQTAESFARIQQKTTQRVNGAVKDLFALAKDPKASPRYRSPKARELDRRAQELDVPRHLARFMGKHDDPVDAFSEKSELIEDVVAHPEKLARHMAENLGDLPTEQPEIFASMVGQTMNVVNYLHERRPGVAGKSALDPEGYPPTFEEISEWAGHFVGAFHPLDSLDDLASNELVPEQIEAVQSLWPEGYTMFQTSAMREIHELSGRPGVISRAALEQIDSALNLDGAGEPTLSSDFAGLLRKAEKADAQRLAAEASKPQPPMQSQSPSRIASSALGSLHAE
jgi:hypothetical protein